MLFSLPFSSTLVCHSIKYNDSVVIQRTSFSSAKDFHFKATRVLQHLEKHQFLTKARTHTILDALKFSDVCACSLYMG